MVPYKFIILTRNEIVILDDKRMCYNDDWYAVSSGTVTERGAALETKSVND